MDSPVIVLGVDADSLNIVRSGISNAGLDSAVRDDVTTAMFSDISLLLLPAAVSAV